MTSYTAGRKMRFEQRVEQKSADINQLDSIAIIMTIIIIKQHETKPARCEP